MKGLEAELFGFDSKSNITTFSANTSRKGKTVDFFEDDDDDDMFVKTKPDTSTKKSVDPYFQDSPKSGAAKPKSKGMLHDLLSGLTL